MEMRSDFKEEYSSDYFDFDEQKREEAISREKKKLTKKIIPNDVQVSWDLFRRYSKIYERGNPLVFLTFNSNL